MKILQIVKTTDGARWALHQVAELCQKGIEVHVVLPSLSRGRFVKDWQRLPVKLYEMNLDFPVRNIWRYNHIVRAAKDLVRDIKPDLIHSHFVGTTLVMREALRRSLTPMIFQVPGPLHMEHKLYRYLDLCSARKYDYWVASSRYTESLYLRYGVKRECLFHSYYGWRQEDETKRDIAFLKEKLCLDENHYIVGNINYMYAPKHFLGQRVGIKRHELIIDALGLLLQKRQDVTGLLIGGAWKNKTWYENKLRCRAHKWSQQIKLPGYISGEEFNSWELFDVAVHAPLSENCGGVVEPLLSGVPTIASRTGGLPEVVRHEQTGYLVEHDATAEEIAQAIDNVLNAQKHYRHLAMIGKDWVKTNFDICNTAQEIYQIYQTILQ